MLSIYFQTGNAFIREQGTGHLVTLVMEGIDKVKNYIAIIGIRTIKTIIVPIGLVGYIYFSDPISAIVLVVTVPVVIIFMILLGLAAQKMADRQYATYSRLANYFLDSLKGLETLSYLGRSRQHVKNIEQVSGGYREATMKTLKIAFLSTFALDFFTSLSIAFVAVGLGLRLIDGTIDLLPALTILILAPEYFSPIKQVGKDYHATLDGQIAMAEIDQLLKEGQPALRDNHGKAISWQPQEPIVFKNISLEPKEGKPLLQQISFEAPGGLTAIVGASGAGKSTLIQVLAGQLDPTAGQIEIAGTPVTTLNNPNWFEKISYIPQHPYIFPMSLADNIRFYEPGATDEAVSQLIERIGLGAFTLSLQDGIHTRIGEGGRSLSGGQAQRVALARALLGKKPVILLDEPTAQLDIETEYEIKQLILSLSKDKHIFLATHRLHWLNDADHVLLLENGKLAGSGNHLQLARENETYKHFIHWRGARNNA